jgi:hypothetical protein
MKSVGEITILPKQKQEIPVCTTTIRMEVFWQFTYCRTVCQVWSGRCKVASAIQYRVEDIGIRSQQKFVQREGEKMKKVATYLEWLGELARMRLLFIC